MFHRVIYHGSMPEGHFGGPRPFAKGEIVIYSRFSIGGDVSADDTEPLQADITFSDQLREDIIKNTLLDGPEVEFHPAGFIVGVEVKTGVSELNKSLVNEIPGISQQFLEAKLNGKASFENPNRREEAVQVRAR